MYLFLTRFQNQLLLTEYKIDNKKYDDILFFLETTTKKLNNKVMQK